jgi:hypothetical protein
VATETMEKPATDAQPADEQQRRDNLAAAFARAPTDPHAPPSPQRRNARVPPLHRIAPPTTLPGLHTWTSLVLPPLNSLAAAERRLASTLANISPIACALAADTAPPGSWATALRRALRRTGPTYDIPAPGGDIPAPSGDPTGA